MNSLAMIVLALDTCTEEGSLALGRNGRLIEERPLTAGPFGWTSSTLHDEIAHLVERHGLETREIDGYGVTCGPGSFTGVRLGLAAIKGLAEVHSKPVVPVSTLEVIAAAAAQISRPHAPELLAPLLDARRGQVFAAVYRYDANRLKAVLDETVSSLSSFLERLKAKFGTGSSGSDTAGSRSASTPMCGLAFCGIALAPYAQELDRDGWCTLERIEVSSDVAGTILEIATKALERGEGVDAALADASYVRRTDAELFWKDGSAP